MGILDCSNHFTICYPRDISRVSPSTVADRVKYPEMGSHGGSSTTTTLTDTLLCTTLT